MALGHEHGNRRIEHPEREVLTVSANLKSRGFRNSMSPGVAAILIENRRTFLRFLARQLGSMEVAEEVLQQFCLRAVSKSSDIKNRESILRWLYRVLSSTLADYYRAQASTLRGKVEYARLQSALIHEFAAEPESVCTCFYELLPTLKSEYAEVLHRIDLRGESRAKAAEDLGITLNLVRVRLHRARHALKDALLASCKGCDHGFMNCECPPRRE